MLYYTLLYIYIYIYEHTHWCSYISSHLTEDKDASQAEAPEETAVGGEVEEVRK